MAYKQKISESKRKVIKGMEKLMIKEMGEETFSKFLNCMGAKTLGDAVENYDIHEKNDPIREANSPTPGYTEAGAIKSMIRISKILFKPGYSFN